MARPVSIYRGLFVVESPLFEAAHALFKGPLPRGCLGSEIAVMAGTVLHCSCKAGVERKAQGSLRERV